MITTNNEAIYKKLLRIRSHGINKLDDDFIIKDQSETSGINNSWYYEMQELGFNYRITDIQCALGKSQLKKLNKFIKRRKDLVKRYDNIFKKNELIKPIQQKYRSLSSHHLYVIQIDYNKIKISRAELMTKLKENGIITQVHYIPVTHHPFYRDLGYISENYINAISFYKKCLTLPLYFSLSNNDQDYVIDKLTKLIDSERS